MHLVLIDLNRTHQHWAPWDPMLTSLEFHVTLMLASPGPCATIAWQATKLERTDLQLSACMYRRLAGPLECPHLQLRFVRPAPPSAVTSAPRFGGPRQRLTQCILYFVPYCLSLVRPRGASRGSHNASILLFACSHCTR